MTGKTPEQTQSLANWQAPSIPARQPLTGNYCSLYPLGPEHTGPLFKAFSENHANEHWTYLPYGPFASLPEFEEWLLSCANSDDTHFYCVCIKGADGNTVPAGVASYLRIKPDSGSIEVGHIHYSSLLQNTCAATEAMYLMMANAFSLGYRRYEWKCDALNEPSRQAAVRLGFTFEGIFRQATVVKGRNRDTAWFSIIDSEWPALERGYGRWLDAANFDAQRVQAERLQDCIGVAV